MPRGGQSDDAPSQHVQRGIVEVTLCSSSATFRFSKDFRQRIQVFRLEECPGHKRLKDFTRIFRTLKFTALYPMLKKAQKSDYLN